MHVRNRHEQSGEVRTGNSETGRDSHGKSDSNGKSDSHAHQGQRDIDERPLEKHYGKFIFSVTLYSRKKN